MAVGHSLRPPVPGDHMTAAATSLDDLQTALGYRFKNLSLLRRALTHASAEPSSNNAYERLEFLGDRVLALVIAERLLERFPDEREGEISRRHVGLVRREALAEVARRMDFGQFLLLSRGEAEAGSRDRESILADVMEAVLAALYLDGGLDTAQRFILDHWTDLLEAEIAPPQDPKTTLQEWAQGRGLPLPSYEVVAQEGPSHAPQFTVRVWVKGQSVKTATGGSKRAAERASAIDLLKELEAQ
jgi:ribonuclease-3